MSVQPYSFVPIYKEKIWGGRALERLFGRELPPRVPIGESWELADLTEGESVVAEGPEAGKTIRQLLSEANGAILGRARPWVDGRFPLLLKLLDANDILSLQVHPDEEAARSLGRPGAAKAECWYVLESREGYILKGVRPGVTAAEFRAALDAGGRREALEGLVVRYNVKAGDFHYLPAGTVHALGPGVVVAEIQTPSDTTYRVSDWGRGRNIHVTASLGCIHFQPGAQEPPGASDEVLVRSAYFTVRRVVQPRGERALPAGACRAWMVLQGRGRISWQGQPAGMLLAPGQTLLVPAALPGPVLRSETEMAYLETTLPEDRQSR